MKKIRIITVLILMVSSLACATIIYVPQQYPTIQAGINAAISGDTVMVDDGVFTGPGNRDLDFGGRAIVVMSMFGADSCIIDCQNSGRGFNFHSYEGINSVVDAFTITHGSTDRGAGIYCDDSSPTIKNCIITQNSANAGNWNYGGGIYCRDSNPVIQDCHILGNSATNGTWCHGAGIYLDGSSPTIAGCTVENNISSGGTWNYGAGIFCDGGSPTVANCTIDGNNVNGGYYAYGAGIKCDDSNLTVSRTLIINNSATGSSRHYGGGVHCSGGIPVIENCTLSGNSIAQTTYTYGAGIYCNGPDLHVVNTIVEASIGGGGIHFTDDATNVSVTYSDFSNNAVGNFTGYPPAGLGIVSGVNYNGDPCDVFYNIFLDPIFVLPGSDFHLQEGSPCIDAGDPQSPLDPDGTIADIGVFYFDQTAPSIQVSSDSLDFGPVIPASPQIMTLPTA
jgi:hypothetical protein